MGLCVLYMQFPSVRTKGPLPHPGSFSSTHGLSNAVYKLGGEEGREAKSRTP